MRSTGRVLVLDAALTWRTVSAADPAGVAVLLVSARASGRA